MRVEEIKPADRQFRVELRAVEFELLVALCGRLSVNEIRDALGDRDTSRAEAVWKVVGALYSQGKEAICGGDR